jgi:hypothetical protein
MIWLLQPCMKPSNPISKVLLWKSKKDLALGGRASTGSASSFRHLKVGILIQQAPVLFQSPNMVTTRHC